MLRRLVALLLVAGTPLAAQQPHERVYVRHAAPIPSGPVIADALAHPYVTRYEKWNTRLFKDSVFATSVVVVGSDATVASTVHGDVLVLEGNVFLRPGAHIDGRAIAVGGRVYDSRDATVIGGKLSYPDVRVDADTTKDGIALDYVAPAGPELAGIFTLPILFGFRVPSYDRVDGLSAVWGPRFSLLGDHLRVDPTVTYRSDLGMFDPEASIDVPMGPDWLISGDAGRYTLTNDGWIRSDPENSLAALAIGHDYRNYWRGDRFRGTLTHTWTIGSARFALGAGAETERDWSVRAGGPWSVTGSESRNGMLRPNPVIEHGRISSVIGNASAADDFGDVKLSADVAVERPFDTPLGERFTQTTFNADVVFPTFGRQRFALHAHGVLTAGDTAPPQRFAYLGGAGTLPTVDIFSLGGDHLLYLVGAYTIPVAGLKVKYLGTPTLVLRDAFGSAGVGRLPRFEQNLGARVGFSFFFVGYDFDPRTHRDAVGFGVRVPGQH
ncbi:MAG TPA: hypothetical protein VF102_09360 [Gemmatimonadaceae bacterium]